ncbi:hypothetical protein AVEN_157546-1 [Araneus ventricosus]|uniref:Uncharacterized protein n=1 Tax=Araneus ventricosus TaxID=182803 RepID=A0A4Y2IDT4_ARAVE|nr:hypothetical protein AVEN_157546-1 [Araneus ventricosus]
MTRIELFGKVVERFASQQGTRFSVRFPQAFITRLFQAFQKVVKSPPSVVETYLRDFVVDCDNTSHSFKPGIEPAFIELERKSTNHYTGRGYTRWDRWFIKSVLTSLREWFPKRSLRKCFRGQPMESEMAILPQPPLLSGTCLTVPYSLAGHPKSINTLLHLVYQEYFTEFSGIRTGVSSN